MTALSKQLFLIPVAICFFIPNVADGQVTLSYTETEYSTSTEVTVYASSDVLLNVFELTLDFFGSMETISDSSIESPLCDPRFLIEEQKAEANDFYYLACGTVTPFISSQPVPILTLRYGGVPGVDIGTQTSFYKHDGLGTQVDWQRG